MVVHSIQWLARVKEEHHFIFSVCLRNVFRRTPAAPARNLCSPLLLSMLSTRHLHYGRNSVVSCQISDEWIKALNSCTTLSVYLRWCQSLQAYLDQVPDRERPYRYTNLSSMSENEPFVPYFWASEKLTNNIMEIRLPDFVWSKKLYVTLSSAAIRPSCLSRHESLWNVASETAWAE